MTDKATDTVPQPEATETAGTTSSPFRWRDVLPIHPAADDYPLMSETDPASLKELSEDIKANGLIDPIVLWTKDGKLLLDGRNRLDAMERAGLLSINKHGDLCDLRSGNEIKLQFYTEGDPYALALSLNVHRRHLTSEQKRDLIAKVLKAKPEASNLQIAKQTKADDKTVAKVRTELETRSEIPNVPTRTDSRGRKQPTKKSKPLNKPKAAPPAPKKATPKPKRTTALDVLDVWKDLPVEEHRHFFDGIGLNAILAGIPEAWLPALEEWIAKRRISAAPRVPQ
jgi:hypothetical protein